MKYVCKLPTTAELWKAFDYKPLTGELVRKQANTNGKNGAGHKDRQGYVFTSLNYQRFPVHRAIYAWVKGTAPALIDHVNEDKADNRWVNLRASNKSLNAFNQRKTKGYSFDKKKNKWRAQITIDRKMKWLGYHETEEAAHQAYLNAKHQHLADK